MTFEQLLADHAVAALDRQLHLADVIGDRRWAVDLKAGTLTFGDDLPFRAQLLGTQSDETDTFSRAWDHPSRPAHTNLAETVRAAGQRLAIPELTDRKIAVTDAVHAHTLGMIAVGVTDAIVMLIHDPAFPKPANEFALLHAATVIPQVLMAVELDHHRAVTS